MSSTLEIKEENERLKAELEAVRKRSQRAERDKQVLERDNQKLVHTREKLISEKQFLLDENKLLRALMFGPKSEKVKLPPDEDQLPLFELDAPSDLDEDEGETTPAGPTNRRKGGRRSLPKALFRRDVLIDLTPEEKICECGTERQRISEETHEVLERIPSIYYVRRFIRPKYACQNHDCDCLLEGRPGVVKIAIKPPLMIPRSMAGHSLLANVLTAKFADGIPFYRLSQIIERDNIKITRETMSRWAVKVADRLKPLWNLLLEDVRKSPVVQMDETHVQVMNEKDRENTLKSFMWVIRGGPPDKPITLYQYDPSRSGQTAQRIIGDYRGIVQTDGYQGYGFLHANGSACLHAGCMQHARRKFTDILKAAGRKRKTSTTDQILKIFTRLYAVERQARDAGMTAETRVSLRREKSVPLMEKLRAILDDLDGNTPPSSLLGKAVSYTLKQWPRLTVYLDHGEVEIDNNLIENDIRPFVIGRKAWLFAGGPGGAEASAILYSMVVTAKHSGWDPYQWMVHTFDRLPNAVTEAGLRALLPTQPPKETLQKTLQQHEHIMKELVAGS